MNQVHKASDKRNIGRALQPKIVSGSQIEAVLRFFFPTLTLKSLSEQHSGVNRTCEKIL